MKKLAIALILSSVAIAGFAQHRHGGYGYGHHHHGGGGWGWVAPALIGGAVVYAATRPTVVQQPPVVVQQPPIVVNQNPQIVYIDGVAYSKQWMQINGQWQEVMVRM